MKCKASPRRNRKACKSARRWPRRLAELEARERAGQEQVVALTAELENLRQQRDAANAALTESKVALASEEQLASSFRQQRTALEQRIRELTQLVEQRKSECSVLRLAQGAGGIGNSGFPRARSSGLQHEREQVNAQTAELLGRKNTQEAEISTREENLRAQRGRLTELQNQRGGAGSRTGAEKHVACKTCAKRCSRNIT